MKITLESTSRIVRMDTPGGTIECRLWEGETERGVKTTALLYPPCPLRLLSVHGLVWLSASQQAVYLRAVYNCAWIDCSMN